MIISKPNEVRALYAKAKENRWVLPCICSENLTTTEAIFAAAKQYADEKKIDEMIVIIAITCNYASRSQAVNYTHTKNWKIGLDLFTNDVYTLANSELYSDLKVMIHLDHIQFDLDEELYNGDLSRFSSIMFDASELSFEENIKLTKAFVAKKGKEIVVEGACDEINSTDSHSNLTTPENAKRYLEETKVDMIVANLGTEHRASGKDLRYHGEVAREIKKEIDTNIVLHGASSASNEQLVNLFSDGVCKVNIWTALERDSSPVLFENMVKNAVKTAGKNTVEKLVSEKYLTEKCLTTDKISLTHCSTKSRQDIIFEEMKKMAYNYFALWYKV